MDFKVAEKAIFPHRANYVIAIDGFLGREWLLRLSRKKTGFVSLIKNAEGLHEILYQCPSCGVEYQMSSSGITLQCNS